MFFPYFRHVLGGNNATKRLSLSDVFFKKHVFAIVSIPAPYHHTHSLSLQIPTLQYKTNLYNRAYTISNIKNVQYVSLSVCHVHVRYSMQQCCWCKQWVQAMQAVHRLVYALHCYTECNACMIWWCTVRVRDDRKPDPNFNPPIFDENRKSTYN
jgi:hypothetical protein